MFWFRIWSGSLSVSAPDSSMAGCIASWRRHLETSLAEEVRHFAGASMEERALAERVAFLEEVNSGLHATVCDLELKSAATENVSAQTFCEQRAFCIFFFSAATLLMLVFRVDCISIGIVVLTGIATFFMKIGALDAASATPSMIKARLAPRTPTNVPSNKTELYRTRTHMRRVSDAFADMAVSETARRSLADAIMCQVAEPGNMHATKPPDGEPGTRHKTIQLA